MRSFLAFLSLLCVVSAAPLGLLSTLLSGDLLGGRHIVVLKPESDDNVLDSILSLVGDIVDNVYRIGPFRGFSASLTDLLLTTLTSLPDIAYIEADSPVQIFDMLAQPDAVYGLARISHTSPSPGYGTEYVFDSSAGDGTCAYIIDTGIFAGHPEFGGRASQVANFVDDSGTDDNGHGTHVAGIIGSATFGVAKNARLLGVKVLGGDGAGSLSQVMAGLDFAVRDAAQARQDGRCPKGTVGNISLGSPQLDRAMNDAVRAAVEQGLFLAVAAGNAGVPVKDTSPASEPAACTVAAIDANDQQASFSNFGPEVDVFAPGVDIPSTFNDGGVKTLSGTSMAAPYVAGLAAYFLGLETTPAESKASNAMCGYIQSLSTKNVVKQTNGAVSYGGNNFIAYNANGA